MVLSQVLAGMGGVGKTQLAARYARTLQRDGLLDLLVWVVAASREAVVAAYAQAAWEVFGADVSAPERAAARFLSWLGGGDVRWLVVLDDVADPADLNGLWPPANPRASSSKSSRNIRYASLPVLGGTFGSCLPGGELPGAGWRTW
ncbi:hypothetical protein IPZ58_17925 [Streptomyces roseoverticillatus]|nr:hypothetical protein [Streptomyces roseoverticillatus]